MSRASKLTLLGTSIMTAATVAIVHFQQKWEREAMHQGVVRDLDQQRIKRERQADFEAQRELETQYLKEQHVKHTTAQERPESSSGVGGGGGG